jgi:signal transduction histidine kinase
VTAPRGRRAPAIQYEVAAGFATALVVLGAVAVLSYRNVAWLVGTTSQLQRTYTVLHTLDQTASGLSDAETGSRGYVITGDARYLAPYQAARAEVARLIDELQRLTADNPRQQHRLARLEPLVANKFDVMQQTVMLRSRGDYTGAVQLVRSGRGLAMMDSVRQLIHAIDTEETSILSARAIEERSSLRNATEAAVAGILLALLVSVTAVLLVQRDVRGRVRAAAAVLHAKEAAEDANRAKSDFLARMSHELRTPLNSVIGFANVLLKNRTGRFAEQDLTYLERIRANGNDLLALINDILDLSKIEAGHVELATTPTAIDAMVRDELARFDVAVRNRAIALRADVPRGLAPLEVDEGRLRQVLRNLIGNALKFTREGVILVRVVPAAADPHRPARIDVVDSGIGIPEERQRAVFEAFEQADSGTSREFGGTGLGLAIVLSLCDLLGYRVVLSSELGLGSVFSVLLTADAPLPPERREITLGSAEPVDGITVSEELFAAPDHSLDGDAGTTQPATIVNKL